LTLIDLIELKNKYKNH